MGGVLQRTRDKMSIVRWLERTSKESAPKRSRRQVSTSDESETADELEPESETESETVETSDEEPEINIEYPQVASSTSAGSTSSGTTSKKRYVKSWERKFPLLYYDPGKKAMLCRSCVKHKMHNTFTNSGCSNFRKTTLDRHTKSNDHIEAIQKDVASSSCTSLPTMIRQGRQLKQEAVISAMRNIYWIATEEIHVALLKYQSLNELVMMQGCAVIKELNFAKNAQYSSHQIAEEMLEAISSCIEESTDNALRVSPFIGTDESTDIAIESNMIVYAKTFHNGEVSTHFLKSIRIEGHATGKHLYKELSSFLEDKEITLDKVSGLSTDGARAMTGLQEGLTGYMYMKRANPFIVPIHCIAHRLSLATSQASKGIPYLQKYKRLLVSVYSYFSHSSVRVDRLREIQTVLDSPVLKYKPLYDVRWLSFHNAVSSVQRTLPAYFDNEASQYDDPIARGLTKQISSFQFIATTNVLWDILDIITRLSKIFQGASVDFAIIQPMVNSALQALQTLKITPGPHLALFLEEIGSIDGEILYKQHTIQVSSKQREDFEHANTHVPHLLTK